MRFKCLRQWEQSDCGLTCIRMCAGYFGKKVPAKELHKILDVSKLGISINDIRECCGTIGMDAFPVRPTVEELYSIPTPAILHWNQNHFVVLYDVDKKKKLFHVADPAIGKLSLDENKLKLSWTSGSQNGLAIIVTPAENFYDIQYRHKRSFGLWKILSKSLSTHRKDFIPVILMSFICMLADGCIPLIFRASIDEGLQMKNINLVWIFILSQIGIFLGSSFFSSITNYILMKVGFKVNMEMVGQYLAKLAGKTMDFFDRKSSAELIQKMNDLVRIKKVLIGLPQEIFFTILNFIVFSCILIYFNTGIFLFFVFMSVLETIFNIIFLNFRKGIDHQTFSASAENRNLVYEIVNGIREIRINSATKNKLNKWKKNQSELDKLSVKSTLLGIWMGGGAGLLSQIKGLTVTGICATLVIKGDMSLGTMFTVSYITGSLSSSFSILKSTITEIQDASISYERIEGVFSENDERRGIEEPKSTSLVLKNIWFRYPGSSSPFVLKNINLEVYKGETVALVGESGCGKTTLIKLLMGVYCPQRGFLNLGGVDVSQLDEDAWLNQCGAVMQNGYIFSGTIIENVGISDHSPDSNKVRYALTVAGLIEFVDSLPMGLATRIGNTGVELSGGQKQRLLIARAVYKNPEILFLDEATSSLDAKNEHEIHDNLNKFCKGKTVIIAAHRLSTVKNADRILFIENGEIIESGTHDELLNKRGRYYKLVSNQLSLSVD